MSARPAGNEAPDRISDLVLERYRLRELPDDEARELESRLTRDGQLRDRLAALDGSDRDIARDYPPSVLARAVAERASSRAGVAPSLRWALPALAIVALVIVIQNRGAFLPSGGADRGGPDGERQKGAAAALFVYRQTSSGSEPLSDNDVAHAGDVIRVGYSTTERRFGAIVSVDGRGVVTTHLPSAGTTSPLLSTGSRMLLDHAFELDDAPSVERFYLITSATPFSLDSIVAELRGAPAALNLPSSFQVVTFSLRKDART